MTRLLLLIAIGVIAYLLLRRWFVRNAPTNKPDDYVPMVSCMRCGLNLPRNTAIERNDSFYCCREHADQATN